jgi:hypothetical protein
MRTAQGPADTRMMGIVHGALRRDLLRTRAALTGEPFPEGRQRRALGEHVAWMMEFLHAHHAGEDEGLWPLVGARNPAAGALLDSLEAEHQLIAPAAATLTAAGYRYAATSADEPRAELMQEYNINRSRWRSWGWRGTGCWTGSTRRATKWSSTRSQRCRGSSCCTASRVPTGAGPGHAGSRASRPSGQPPADGWRAGGPCHHTS